MATSCILVASSPSSPPASYSRKRTSSFSVATKALAPSPRPLKAQRTMSSITCTTTTTFVSGGNALRRTTTYLSLPATLPQASSAAAASSSKLQPSIPLQSQLPYQRTLKYYKDQRERRKAQVQQRTPASQQHLTISTTHVSNPTPIPPKPVSPPQQRQPSTPKTSVSYMKGKWKCSSPLAPTHPIYTPVRTQSASDPPRTCFPRSKPDTDLHRKAIQTRMRSTPEGQKILLMGARLAVSIIEATRELESLVAASNSYGSSVECERDDPMEGLENSWVCVPGEDWEMVDC